MFRFFKELFFPKKCINCGKFGSFICANCFSKIHFADNFCCPVCQRPAINGQTHPICMSTQSLNGAVWAVFYGPVIRKIIYKFKYRPYLSELASIIGEIMVEGLSQNESFYVYTEKYKPVVLPIPLSDSRLRERGYNHAELIASHVAQYFNLKLNNNLLIRTKDTKPQYKLGREERTKNIRGAFEVSRNAKNIPENIILIDDIATSFSTLREAAKILKRRGAKRVLGVTFAREV